MVTAAGHTSWGHNNTIVLLKGCLNALWRNYMLFKNSLFGTHNFSNSCCLGDIYWLGIIVFNVKQLLQ